MDRYNNLVQKYKLPKTCKYCDSKGTEYYGDKLVCDDHYNKLISKDWNYIYNILPYGDLLKNNTQSLEVK